MNLKAKNTKNRSNVHSSKRPCASVTTRIVAQSRWVHRNQLELGMYINELDKPWEDTRFLYQGFVIDSYELLRAVQNACEYANIQTEKVAMLSSNSVHRLIGAMRN